MKRCFVFAAGTFYGLRECPRKEDFVIAADAGYRVCQQLGIVPDLLLGDFDSMEQPVDFQNICRSPVEKDDTDTFAAVKLMIEKGFLEFLLVGVIGERLDHTFGNVSILIYLKEKGAKGVIVDDYSEMFLCDKNTKIKAKTCSFFSLISLSDKLEGVCIKGAKYPLEYATIKNSYQFAVSNEALCDTEISVEKGDALIIKVY